MTSSPAQPPSVPEWRSVHVHCHQVERTDDLLIDAVAPLLAEIAELAPDAYFVRHWIRGPHVRVNIRAAEPDWTNLIMPIVLRRLRDYLAAAPSAGHPDSAAEAVLHQRLAALEAESGPLSPWYPDNSVQVLPFDARLHVLGTQAAADLLTEFHVATTPLSWQLLRDKRNGQPLADSAIAMMLSTTLVACPPITRGYLSYRSHAEGFFANTGDPAAIRAHCDAMYQRNRVALRDTLVAAVAGEPARNLPPRWPELIAEFCARATALHTGGELVLPDILDPAALEPPVGRVSAFHRGLFGNPAVRAELSTSTWFAAYRVVLNYQYLLFSRLGMLPRERFTLCHLLACAVEDEYGIGWDWDLGTETGTGLPMGATSW